MKRFTIRFKYSDSMSGFRWKTQACHLYAEDKATAISKCIKLYGLGVDCEYEIVSVEEV